MAEPTRPGTAGQDTGEITDQALWQQLAQYQGQVFYTARKLPFTYELRGNEMYVSRKDKSITRATVELAFANAKELGGQVTGPKMLGCFGASYLYPIFARLGVVELSARRRRRRSDEL